MADKCNQYIDSTVDPNELFCSVCGERAKLNLPMEINDVVKKIDAFEKLHEECNK